nr:putative integron gene cassette protein [uncultured bacterium]
MTQYLIEREIAGAGDMLGEALREASKHPNAVLAEMSPDIQWVHSYVAGDKIHCIYNAPSEELIREHAEKSGFPANKITPVTAVIDPSTGK